MKVIGLITPSQVYIKGSISFTYICIRNSIEYMYITIRDATWYVLNMQLTTKKSKRRYY